MTFQAVERVAQLAGAVGITVTLAVVLLGLWSGLRRPAGRTTGYHPGMLRSSAFYLAASIFYFGTCCLLWKPLPVTLSTLGSFVALALGGLLLYAGLGLVMWGRLALGEQYFVSTSMAAQLFADHRLATHGPYALVRHPMYLGFILTGVGGLLLYLTWTFVFVSLSFLGLVTRARREEQVLEAEFGDAYRDYRQQVPGWIPRLWKQNGETGPTTRR